MKMGCKVRDLLRIPEPVRDPVRDPGPGPGRSRVRATLRATAGPPMSKPRVYQNM